MARSFATLDYTAEVHVRSCSYVDVVATRMNIMSDAERLKNTELTHSRTDSPVYTVGEMLRNSDPLTNRSFFFVLST